LSGGWKITSKILLWSTLKGTKTPKDLAKASTRNTPMLADVFFQIIEEALVKIVMPEPKMINIIEGEDWQAPIMANLHHYYEPDSINEQIRMQQ
jgi:hypothetical protein